MSGVIRWEEPPADRRGGGVSDHWQAIAIELCRNQDRWAVVMEGDSGPCAAWVNRIKTGKSAFKPAGAFEAVVRTDDGKGVVYARYVGGGGRS